MFQVSAELPAMVRLEDLGSHLVGLVEDQVQDAELQRPEQGLGEKGAIAEEGYGDTEVEDILVEQSYDVVFTPHQPVGDIVGVEPLLGLADDVWTQLLQQEAAL